MGTVLFIVLFQPFVHSRPGTEWVLTNICYVNCSDGCRSLLWASVRQGQVTSEEPLVLGLEPSSHLQLLWAVGADKGSSLATGRNRAEHTLLQTSDFPTHCRFLYLDLKVVLCWRLSSCQGRACLKCLYMGAKQEVQLPALEKEGGWRCPRWWVNSAGSGA